MKIKYLLVPDEWLSAAEAGQDLCGTLAKTAHGAVKTLCSLMVPLGFGSAAFYFFDRHAFTLVPLLDADVLRAADGNQ